MGNGRVSMHVVTQIKLAEVPFAFAQTDAVLHHNRLTDPRSPTEEQNRDERVPLLCIHEGDAIGFEHGTGAGVFYITPQDLIDTILTTSLSKTAIHLGSGKPIRLLRSPDRLDSPGLSPKTHNGSSRHPVQ